LSTSVKNGVTCSTAAGGGVEESVGKLHVCIRHDSIYHSRSFVIAKLLRSTNIDNNLADTRCRS
jgi:hypothetical protein